MKDEKLVKAFLNGDEDAFHSLMSRYQRQVFYTVKAVVLNSEEAKDVTQKAFIKVFQNLHALKNPSRFKGWLFKIAMNTARDHLRTKRHEIELNEAVMDTSSSLERRIAARDMVERIKAVLDRLAPRQRMVLGLHLFKEMEPLEIARILDMKPATVRTNLHFGLKNLRTVMKKEGIVP